MPILINRALQPIQKTYRKSYQFIKAKPFTVFLIFLAITLALIILSTGAFKAKPSMDEVSTPVKEVRILDINQNPSLSFIAVIQKEGVINIRAQTSGIINKIYTIDGKTINKNSPILYIASNYQGQSLPTLSKEISLQTYQNTKNTYNDRLDIINKNKETAEKSEDEDENLREIREDSLDRTGDLINLNESILGTINTQIENLESSGAPDEDTLVLRQSKAQVESVLSQLKNTSANEEFALDEDKETREIDELRRGVSIKQLDLEKQALDLSLKTAELQYKIAQVTESFSYPAAPFYGTIQKIHVKEGATINPGDLLATIASPNKKASGDILISKNVAEKIDINNQHLLHAGENSANVSIKFVTSEAVNGTLFNATFDIPQDLLPQIIDSENLSIDLKLKTNSDPDRSGYPIVPIEAIQQTKTQNFVYIIEQRDGKNYAKSVEVEIGQSLDGYVEITKGLNVNDKVIITRNVASGDEIKF